ncbi:MAG TPA: heavy metal transporter [Anaerolineaceae bacterium]|uniref:Putative heavy metal binding protein n=1 Tax=Anaerolinea thermophila TaxID=167964 RepID=A0A101FZ26_9CHLR|nr:MAG: Putative heavy metal binding protein [Anaerolinea thermophila]HAF62198.1 heavy metal transporter [Anaerolineaceae bacterium]
MTKTYSVPNIHCQHCVHTINMELSDIEGINTVQADLDSKSVKVDFENADVEQIILNTLEEIGYPVAQ